MVNGTLIHILNFHQNPLNPPQCRPTYLALVMRWNELDLNAPLFRLVLSAVNVQPQRAVGNDCFK